MEAASNGMFMSSFLNGEGGHWSDQFSNKDSKNGKEDKNSNSEKSNEKSQNSKSSESTVNNLNQSADSEDDNGYDKNGKQINNEGGDKTDYLYDEKGNIISSKKVVVINDENSEISSDYRAYGIKIKTEGTGVTWSLEELGATVLFAKVASSKYFNDKLVKPAFKALGGFIKKYVPTLGANRYLRIGLSHTRGREVFRITTGGSFEHILDIDLGPVPKIK